MLILFPDDWAAYSPTLLRLADLLSKYFTVHAHVLDTGRVDNGILDPARFHRIKVPGLLAQLLKKTGCYRLFRTLALAHSARKDIGNSTQVIAIDADGAMAAKLLGKPFHFLSLEIGWHPILQRLVGKHALSITIQSPERLEYQFGKAIASKLPVFYVQNAPDAPISPIASTHHAIDRSSPRLVYLGHIMPLHGLVAMLELIRAWPEATLTLQGIHTEQGLAIIREQYQDLVNAGRIIISKHYVPESSILTFLSNFDIGLCLYELDRHSSDFNYLSSPAGKMFNYFAAALPVIASDFVGLNPVSLHHAGIQVRSHRTETLLEACQNLMTDYTTFSEGARKAAVHYDFRRSASHLINLLRDGTGR
ncbi:hypothetical protein [Dyella subtropica]|uniref:hypothetical protein n=1 Tax=Dyella subtropica TaxID=2992127 RepID=UPI002253932A|nr:hypothetical protein [Dyella subtropica]